MWQQDSWDDEVARRYDTPGIGMFAPEVLDPVVDRLAELAGGGRVLELAVGTGRVAVPLAGRGVDVTGIELSPAMLAVLRTKADASRIPVLLGDMASVRAPGEFSLVYLVYNTISNLLAVARVGVPAQPGLTCISTDTSSPTAIPHGLRTASRSGSR